MTWQEGVREWGQEVTAGQVLNRKAYRESDEHSVGATAVSWEFDRNRFIP